MNEKQLTDVIHQHTHDITALIRKINEMNADLQIVLKDQSKLSQLVEAQIKTTYEITNIKDDLKSTNASMAVMNSTLKNIETSLLQKDAADIAKSTLKADLKKYLPALLILCASMFIFGIILDDMKLVHTLLGK